jgi:hypothetical protein
MIATQAMAMNAALSGYSALRSCAGDDVLDEVPGGRYRARRCVA